MGKRLGKQTVKFQTPPVIAGAYAAVGNKEGDGPLKGWFDCVYADDFMGQDTWEKAESKLIEDTVSGALLDANVKKEDVHYLFTGDLLNQCAGSSFGIKTFGIPFFGIFGACSTMCEGLSLAAMTIDGGFAECCVAATESHFCSAERQFRFPLEYGGVRAPTSQWTVTGSGAAVLKSSGEGPRITHVTTGKIVDMGITDANNMGAAMAPSAADTLYRHFTDTGRKPEDYDYIVTGDLGRVGSSILIDLMKEKGYDLQNHYVDCGCMIFDESTSDTKAGGSGCGCCGSVFCGYHYKRLKKGELKRILVMATGALMSTTTTQQGSPIMGIAHAVAVEGGK